MNGKPKRLQLLAVASVAGLGAFGLAAAPAGAVTAGHASTFSPATSITWEPALNSSSGLCLDTGATNAAATMVSCNYSNDLGQQWYGGTSVTGPDGTASQFKNNKNQCLGVSGGSTASGAVVIAETCGSAASHPDQYWYNPSTPTCLFMFMLTNYKSGMALNQSGSKVVQKPFQASCNGPLTQFWYIPLTF